MDIIKSVACGRGIIEWNIGGFCDYKEGIHMPDLVIEEALNIFSHDIAALERKVVVLKDISRFLDDGVIVGKIKNIALQITRGLECNIIILSPIVKDTQELEKIYYDFRNGLSF